MSKTPSVQAQLQEKNQLISKGMSSEKKAEILGDAFELFSQEAARLKNAYNALNEQFRLVNVEVEEVNRALSAKVSELDGTTMYLNSILNHIAQGIVFVGLTGTVTTYNPAAEKLLGKKEKSVLYQPFWESFPDSFFGFSMQEVLSTGKAPPSCYISLEHSQEGRLELGVSTTFILSGNKSHHGLTVLLRDITEVRRLLNISSRNDRMKELGEMAASVAHEIRNPLGGIRGFASLLHRDLISQPEQQQMASYIIEGTLALDRLVTQVLNYSRPLQMRFETTDMTLFLKKLYETAHVDNNLGNQTQIKIVTPSTALFADIDPQMLRSALYNLILNAAQAMPLGGTITLSVRHSKRHIEIGVEDTGQGIAPEHLEKIFSPFFTTKPKGNGFGLTEVHKIVQAHSGTIDVVSVINKGTTFTIRIPMSSGST